MNHIRHIVSIDECSITPKYLQVIDSILQGIQSGEIKQNDLLPSINELSCMLDTARSTIERAYNELKRMGLVASVAGKGYFIVQTNCNNPTKILLLFNKLSTHKKMIYDAFATRLGSQAVIDFYIYNSDYNYFKQLVKEKAAYYTKCVIIPHFCTDKDLGYNLINSLPKNKLILMDKLAQGVCGNFGAVYEDFENDIYDALQQLSDRLNKYHTIKIIFPEQSYYSHRILDGFTRFCKEYDFNFEVLDNFDLERIEKGNVYINLAEDDLVVLIEKILEQNYEAGKDVGVISYNETPIKKIILNGITTISTDFHMIGRKAAELVLANSSDRIAVPFTVTVRNSI